MGWSWGVASAGMARDPDIAASSPQFNGLFNRLRYNDIAW
jgi:hypothetical protein